MRYTYVDLSNKAVQAGRLDSVTLGLNWYLNANAKMQFNYDYTQRRETPNLARGGAAGRQGVAARLLSGGGCVFSRGAAADVSPGCSELCEQTLGNVREKERSPGGATEPSRGFCRPSGARFLFADVSQGLRAFGSLHPGLTSAAAPRLKDKN